MKQYTILILRWVKDQNMCIYRRWKAFHWKIIWEDELFCRWDWHYMKFPLNRKWNVARNVVVADKLQKKVLTSRKISIKAYILRKRGEEPEEIEDAQLRKRKTSPSIPCIQIQTWKYGAGRDPVKYDVLFCWCRTWDSKSRMPFSRQKMRFTVPGDEPTDKTE